MQPISSYFNRRVRAAASTLLFVVVLLGLTGCLSFRFLASVSFDQVNGVVSAYDSEGNIAFVQTFEGEIVDALIANNSVIVAFGRTGALAGHVIALSATGKRIWDFDTYSGFGFEANSHYFEVRGIRKSNLDGSGLDELVVWAGDPTWYWSRLLVLDPRSGDRIGDFAHPGLIYTVEISNMDSDDIKEVLVRAVNNKLLTVGSKRADVVILFEGDNIHGAGPKADSSSLEVTATFQWYLVPHPVILDDEKAYFATDGEFATLADFRDRNSDGTSNASIRTRRGDYIYITKGGDLLHVGYSDYGSGSIAVRDMYSIRARSNGYYRLTNLVTKRTILVKL